MPQRHPNTPIRSLVGSEKASKADMSRFGGIPTLRARAGHDETVYLSARSDSDPIHMLSAPEAILQPLIFNSNHSLGFLEKCPEPAFLVHALNSWLRASSQITTAIEPAVYMFFSLGHGELPWMTCDRHSRVKGMSHNVVVVDLHECACNKQRRPKPAISLSGRRLGMQW